MIFCRISSKLTYATTNHYFFLFSLIPHRRSPAQKPDRHDYCTPLEGRIFGENRTTPLWTFFKKLFNYDYAILVLADDNIIPDLDSKDSSVWVAKDNLNFITPVLDMEEGKIPICGYCVWPC